MAKSDAFLGVALAVLSWPVATTSLTVAPGLDESWRAALATAAHDHIPFGSRVVFTYGPLSFLVSPGLFFRWTSILGLIFTLVFQTVLFVVLVRALRRTIPLPLAVLAAYLAGTFSQVSSTYFGNDVAVEDVLALVMVACVSVMSRPRDDPAPRWLWIVLGATGSTFSLIKLSLGVGIAVAVVITVCCVASDHRPAIAMLVLGAVPAFCVAWFATGNGFGNLPAFVRSSASVIGGYGDAMGLEDPQRWYSYYLAAAVVVIVGAFAWGHARRLGGRAQAGIGLVTLSTLWFLFKEGFVRHDAHDLVFFVAAPLVLVAFSPGWRSPAWVLTGVFALTVVVASVAAAAPALTPVQALRNFADEAATVLQGGRAGATVTTSRRLLRAHYDVSKVMLAAMRGSTVDVSPWEQALVWAYPGLRFDPLPVVQDYNAYTPYLDQLDAEDLASANAPRFILRQPLLAIDGRNPVFEPPATQLAIECRYRQVAIDIRWQLLERGPDACGPPRLIARFVTGLGQTIVVPSAPARDAVVARFDLSSSPWSKVVSLIYKPSNVYLSANGHRRWRFVVPTAPDLHLLRASSVLGYTFGGVPSPIKFFSLSTDGSGRQSSGVTVSFYEIAMTRSPEDPAIGP